MKNQNYFFVSTNLKTVIMLVAALFAVSCGNRTEQLQQQVDSLKTILEQSRDNQSSMNEFLTVISESLDSINAQEESIFRHNSESPLPDRNQMKRSLIQLKETVQNQRKRIEELEKELANGRGDVKKLHSIIKALKQQIEEKDARITELMAQLEESKLSVSQLSQRVGSLTQKTTEQESQIAEQEEVMKAQDEALNEAYIKIGTKSELKSAGLLSGGFLKKSKVDYSKINLESFRKIDIREVQSIMIPSKSAKLLTPAPSGSYSMKQNGNQTELVINDPTRFWSVSNFLIIQTK